jgi:hypothetical protein
MAQPQDAVHGKEENRWKNRCSAAPKIQSCNTTRKSVNTFSGLEISGHGAKAVRILNPMTRVTPPEADRIDSAVW